MNDEMECAAKWLWRARDLIDSATWHRDDWETLAADKKAKWINHVCLQFAAIAPTIRAAERERCARVADGYGWHNGRAISERHEAAFDRADQIAAAIRAMGGEA